MAMQRIQPYILFTLALAAHVAYACKRGTLFENCPEWKRCLDNPAGCRSLCVLHLAALVAPRARGLDGATHPAPTPSFLRSPTSAPRYLSQNKLSGTIPDRIGELTDLEVLSLANVGLSGTLPSATANLHALKRLYLHGNMLSGTLGPAMFTGMVSIREMYFQNNALVGTLPETIDAATTLQYFNVNNNKISGTLTRRIGNMTGLVKLKLGRNSISGSLPSEWSTCSNLTTIDVHDNLLGYTGNATLDGTVLPVEYDAIPRLETLATIGNSISVTANMSEYYVVNRCADTHETCTSLWIPSLGLGGTIPGAILGAMTNLVRLGLHGNDLVGTLPIEIGQLVHLKELYLHGNPHLSGTIPVEWAALTALEMLQVSESSLMILNISAR